MNDIDINVGTASIMIPSMDEILRAAPIAGLTVLILTLGVAIAWFFTKHHIKSLKDYIEYLKNK